MGIVHMLAAMIRLVCENHPTKAWPTQCDCGAGMPLTARNVAGLYPVVVNQSQESIMSRPSVDPVEAGLIGDPRSQVNFQQAVRVGEHEQALARIANEGKRAGEGVDYGETQERKHGTAEEHKQFLDDNDVRTEDRADREEASEARPKGDLPEGDPSREPMNKTVKAKAAPKPMAHKTDVKRGKPRR